MSEQQHPLTDFILCSEFPEHVEKVYSSTFDHIADGMRAAADWQLEQMKQEVKRRLKVWRKSGYVAGADAAEDFFEEVIQQIRPQ